MDIMEPVQGSRETQTKGLHFTQCLDRSRGVREGKTTVPVTPVRTLLETIEKATYTTGTFSINKTPSDRKSLLHPRQGPVFPSGHELYLTRQKTVTSRPYLEPVGV